jgi:hypothetical protein
MVLRAKLVLLFGSLSRFAGVRDNWLSHKKIEHCDTASLGQDSLLHQVQAQHFIERFRSGKFGPEFATVDIADNDRFQDR